MIVKNDILQKYMKSIRMIIHTGFVNARDIDKYDEMKLDERIKYLSNKNAKGNNTFHTNVNDDKKRRNPKTKLIEEWSKAIESFNEIFSDYGVLGEKFARIDFAFNTFSKGDFHRFKKISNLIVSLVCMFLGITNAFSTERLFSKKKINYCGKNSKYEIEAYDKEYESKDRIPTKNRLELRSLALDKGAEGEFYNWQERIEEASKDWKRILSKALAKNNYLNTQKHINKGLIEYYNELLDSTNDHEFRIKEFVVLVQDYIFTRKQLVELLKHIEGLTDEQAQTKANNLTNRIGIIYYSTQDLKKIRDTFIQRINEYFEN